MQEIPMAAREYLLTNDALVRAQISQRYPDLQQILADPQTRAAILAWLASDQAWEPANTEFVANCLAFLRSDAEGSEESIVRTFLLHGDPYVRLRAYEFLLTLYFPDKNREAMFLLLHGMLADSDDAVRAQAARYIERAHAASALEEFLTRWYKAAPGRGWNTGESFELVERLLQQ